ncbi:TPA: hypothetical protein GJ769_12680 [Legionella pneumophila]|nr:hypothetical protein [Legionella pneumophila]HAT7913555.1 hypothetical protein [Legionella pneumophila]HAT7916636.1 hypothetical protein [Legionella pneumophila]HAT7983358.1 hypothetical protein [Legionella pneumophila]HAT7989832.1 hypothetical protein [Legionella pneumophila]
MNLGKYKRIISYLVGILFVLMIGIFVYIYTRYHVENDMTIKVKEYTKNEYPDNPAALSSRYGDYSHSKLVLKNEGDSHFTLTFLPDNALSATITFKNIDAALMTPSITPWVKNNPNLTRISLTDRQWNRQQVIFDANTTYLEVKGGDGVEKNQLVTAELAKNCLNAGLWELLLYIKENDKKKLVYQGWFTFPLGYYKTVFEDSTGLSYRNHWYYLEHWFDPKGTKVQFDALRDVKQSYPVELHCDFNEPAIAEGEQINKKKNIIANHAIHRFQDYYRGEVEFSTFLPPGIYRREKPWNNEFWRIHKPVSAELNNIRSPAIPNKSLQEIVIHYVDKDNKPSSFYVSGFDRTQLPHLDVNDYAKGTLYLMGIGTAPLKENYISLINNPPEKTPLFSVSVNENNEWINHHKIAIDGSYLFLDKNHVNRLHLYLVSYERHAVVAHYWMELPQP